MPALEIFPETVFKYIIDKVTAGQGLFINHPVEFPNIDKAFNITVKNTDINMITGIISEFPSFEKSRELPQTDEIRELNRYLVQYPEFLTATLKDFYSKWKPRLDSKEMIVHS